MSLLPPCRSSLNEHVKQVNYQVCIWKRSHIAKPDIPPAENGHGWVRANETLEPRWFSTSEMPIELEDIGQTYEKICDEASSDSDDNVLSETDSCDYNDEF